MSALEQVMMSGVDMRGAHNTPCAQPSPEAKGQPLLQYCFKKPFLRGIISTKNIILHLSRKAGELQAVSISDVKTEVVPPPQHFVC